jgi:glycosyltransferase involved in cell wall biosynthesis
VSPSRTGSDLFVDHPIRPVHKDPLARFNEVSAPIGLEPNTTTGSARPRVGYACLWGPIPELTWSYSAWNLREGLRLVTDTTDIGVQIPPLSLTALKAIHTRYRGRLTTTWSFSRLTEAYNAHALRRELSRNPAARRCDAVLMIGDLATVPVPYFVYYDTSHDAFISATQGADVYAAMKLIAPSTLTRLRERQRSIYERATGVIAMSHWFARCLVEQTGLPSEKVHVVHPGNSFGRALRKGDFGIEAATSQGRQQPRPSLRERAAPRRRLLFIGRMNHDFDFYAKGGDLVLAALALLRRDHDSQITLTIAGPDKWPLPGIPPEGVRFLGSLPPDELVTLYDSHDLFVMPSRMEGFGIVFTEALARGLPCIGRDAYAMPEIITPGVTGALISGNDEHELAAVIAAALADDTLYEACHERAPQLAAYFSWERAAREMVSAISTKESAYHPSPILS